MTELEQTAVTLKQLQKPREEKKKEEEKTGGIAGVTPEKAKVEEKETKQKKEAGKDKGGKKEEKKREIVLERVYVVPLTGAYEKPRPKRLTVAARLLRAFAAKHLKTELGNVKILNEVSAVLSARGSRKPPKKIAIRVSKDKEGIVEVALKK